MYLHLMAVAASSVLGFKLVEFLLCCPYVIVRLWRFIILNVAKICASIFFVQNFLFLEIGYILTVVLI